ncbi:hypothetical protein Dsin_004936 [Dipteronia sinensis]|uniref:Uncharacterized protein n=1 Tax=Dipteronia sinensis TaxID=43782 RepID=A0AAE0AWV0_9ROSI|nr:hypothetical protein Dsin_004936 [Dipteronia sinensis]
MSNELTTSELNITRTTSDLGDQVEEGVEADLLDVERQITINEPLGVEIDEFGMVERGAVLVVAQRAEFPEFIDVEEPSCSGRPLGILAGDNPRSVLTDDDMDNIRTIYGIPDDVVLRAAKEHERADWDIPGWTCFYEYNFSQRFRFSVPSLARRFLVYYDIAPGQLMPNSWRILISLVVLREKYNLKFGIGSLLHSYYLKQHMHEKDRLSLILRSNATQLITDLIMNDRRWKDMFFFTKGPLIDGPFRNEKYIYPRLWNIYESATGDHKLSCDDAVSCAQKVLEIPVEGNVLMAEFNMPDSEEALKRQKEAMAKKSAAALAKKKSA